MEKLAVHILFEHGEDLRPHGVAYIRALLPMTHSANAESLFVTHGREYSHADVVVVQRLWKPDITLSSAETLVEQVRKDRACLVYLIDDNLLELERFSIEERMIVRYFTREANGVIVSTEALKERLRGLNKMIVVVPNSLDEHLFRDALQRSTNRRTDDRHMIIGFMGTYTHDSDLMMVLQALRKILRGYKDKIEFQLVGGIAHPAVIQAFKSLPLRILQVEERDVAYPNFVRWMIKNLRWDFGIAPLEDTGFNHSKSDIKFLDYSALGIAGVYSKVPAYIQTVRHLKTGYLTENTPEAWVEAMECMLTDDDLRQELALRAQNYVFSERTLEHCSSKWLVAIQEIAS